MNANKNKVAARITPETRFELRPEAAPRFRAKLDSGCGRLKARLLAAQLELAGNPRLNAPIRRAANEAAALAWVTFYPLLVFPGLFAEKVGQAERHAERQARIYAN